MAMNHTTESHLNSLHPLQGKDREIQIIYDLLDKLKIYDIVLSYDKNGILQARDDDETCWTGQEVYLFITEECLCFKRDGQLAEGQHVPKHILEPYKVLSARNGVIPGRPELNRISSPDAHIQSEHQDRGSAR